MLHFLAAYFVIIMVVLALDRPWPSRTTFAERRAALLRELRAGAVIGAVCLVAWLLTH